MACVWCDELVFVGRYTIGRTGRLNPDPGSYSTSYLTQRATDRGTPPPVRAARRLPPRRRPRHRVWESHQPTENAKQPAAIRGALLYRSAGGPAGRGTAYAVGLCRSIPPP